MARESRKRIDLGHDLSVVVCAAGAGVHGALAPEHVREETGAGVGFLASAVLLGACNMLSDGIVHQFAARFA